MILPQTLINRFDKVREQGDLIELSKILSIKSRQGVSRIMLGKQETKIGNIAAIKKFIEKREAEIAKLSAPKVEVEHD